jgi:hypothetical protein
MATSASSVARTTASMASSTASTAMQTAKAMADGSSHAGSEEDDAKSDQLIDALGFNSTAISHVRERERIYKLFEQLGDPQEQEKEKGVGVEQFVKAMMVEMKSTVQWADAAFRAFAVPGKCYLGRREFVLAMASLKTNKASLGNVTWLQLRRRVLFTFYNRSRKAGGELSFADFADMLDDLGDCNRDPEIFGIINKAWSQRLQPSVEPPKSAADHDEKSIVTELVMTKLALAMKKSELEALQNESGRMKRQIEALGGSI